MKLVIAVIQPEELPEIKEELLKEKFSNLLYQLREDKVKKFLLKKYIEEYHMKSAYLKKVRLEIAVNDNFVDSVIEAITTVAKKEGDKGRGKILYYP